MNSVFEFSILNSVFEFSILNSVFWVKVLGFIVLSVLDLRRNSKIILLYRKNRKEFATGSMPTMTI